MRTCEGAGDSSQQAARHTLTVRYETYDPVFGRERLVYVMQSDQHRAGTERKEEEEPEAHRGSPASGLSWAPADLARGRPLGCHRTTLRNYTPSGISTMHAEYNTRQRRQPTTHR